MKYIKANSVNSAYQQLLTLISTQFEYVLDSRIGKTIEIMNPTVEIEKCDDYFITLPESTKIDKKYADAFWEFMISGWTNAEEAYKEYPNVAQFIKKPESSELPDNFNTFYGPRIVSQLPAILKELKTNPNSRRAVIQILMERDQILLDTNEKLEYPCCDSITLYIRDGKLNSHVHMRSENVAVVFKLDMYLQGKFLQYVSKELNIDYNKLTFSMVSAHIYERDFEYIKHMLLNYNFTPITKHLANDNYYVAVNNNNYVEGIH